MSNPSSETFKFKNNPTIDKNNSLQIDALAKLFECEFEDVIDAIEKSNGSFIGVFEVITSKKN